MDEMNWIKSENKEVSPYDEMYPIMFLSNGIKERMEQAENAVKEVYKAISKEAPLIAQIQQSTKKGFRYVVDATDSTLNAIESGKIKLTTEKSGKIFAQIREANGHYGSKLPIKKEDFKRGFDPIQMTNAIQMKALQDQMQVIADQIYMIDQSVREVLQGQQNDRIGLYYSGMALFLESRTINNLEMKSALTAQALRSLAESTFQLTLTMQSDIQYLVNKEYSSVKGKRTELIDSRMKNINKSFAFIHQATMLRAGIYCSNNELAAMSTVLNEYSRFIEGTVAKNASLLAQCDTTDTGTKNGIWNSRAKLKLDVSDFTKQISTQEKTLYIGLAKEND